MNRNNMAVPTSQRGAATLLISMVLLIAVTLVVIVTARTAFMEQRMSGNEIRAKQATVNAQTGIERAIGCLSDSAIANKPNACYSATVAGAWEVGLCDPTAVVATCADITNCTRPAQAAYVVAYACGWSDDGTAEHRMAQVILKGPSVANPPMNPLTTKGMADIRGSGTITNPEGNMTIWSGRDVEFNGASPKTMIPDANDTDDDGNGVDDELVESSDKDSVGLDVIDNDTSLSTLTDTQYFQNFFGATPADYEASYATLNVAPGDVGSLDGETGEIIWVDGDARFTSNTTIGSEEEPVILIVDGEMFGAGRVTVYGILYVTGDWDGQGNLTVYGSVIVRGNVEGTGSLDVIFDSSVVNRAGNTTGPYSTLAGSWRDWL